MNITRRKLAKIVIASPMLLGLGQSEAAGKITHAVMRPAAPRERAYREIAYYADHINAIRSNGTYSARLGLICTVFMRRSNQPAVIEKIMQCFDCYARDFGKHLKTYYHSISERGFPELRSGSIAKSRKELEKYAAAGSDFSWGVQSEKTGDNASEYCIETMNAPSYAIEANLGYLKITLPWKMLETPAGERQFLDWVRYLCEELDIEHGYAGLSCVLPHNVTQYQPYDFRITSRYSGLMEDSSPYLETRDLEEGIKGVNWLTLLDPRYIDALGGKEALTKALKLPGVEVAETANGRFIIKAGIQPAVGAPEKGHPLEYVAVNRVLKPVRVPIGTIDQLHTEMDDAVGFTEKTTNEWLTRFDDPEPKSHLPSQPHNSIMLREGGESCPQTGVWWSPAVPPNESGARRFKKGDTMPNYPLSKYGSTIWYWQSK